MADEVGARMRRDYSQRPLDEHAVADDPFTQFRAWLEEATTSGLLEPNAAALGTADAHGRVSVRMVLLKGVDGRGFVFFTNLDSRKARDLAANPQAALTFWWDRLERQVRIEGRVEPASPEEADEYFATRPRGAQIGAWASPQSKVIPTRALLEAEVERQAARFEGRDVPRPPHWGGYRLIPDLIELWQGRDSRLHDRLCYRGAGERWVLERLAP